MTSSAMIVTSRAVPHPETQRRLRRLNRRPRALSLSCAALVLVAVGVPVRADQVALKSGKVHHLVKIRDVREGKLVFRPTAGRERSIRLNEVQFIEVATLDEINRAEGEFDAGRYADSARTYERFLSQAGPSWQERWARYRLLRAYDRMGEFAKAVEQYCLLVATMPNSTTQLMPTQWPDASSTFYQDALETLKRASRKPKSMAVQEALKRLTLRIQYKIRGTPGSNDSGSSVPPDNLGADAEERNADSELSRHLDLVSQAYERRAYAKVVELVDAVLLEASDEESAWLLLQRGKALFHLAQDKEQYLEACLSLLRVVIHLPGSEPAAEAGYYAGLAMERMKRQREAQDLWREALRKAQGNDRLKQQITLSIRRVAETPVRADERAPD